jgi:hypothetical protein
VDVVTPDYYATLGVAPSSEDVVIRAAYLALMRRYHPDRNPSAEAAARARAITTAYAVLSDWERRAEYDLIRAEGAAAYVPPRRSRPSPTALFAVAAIALLLMVVIWPSLPERGRPILAGTGQAPTAAASKRDFAAGCATRDTDERIKDELFLRAARLRGSDQAALEQIAGASLVRVENAELMARNELLGTIRCRATVTVDLPPGAAAPGGRRSLTAEIGYSLEADGSGEIRLHDDGLVVAPLAALVQPGRSPAVDDEEPATAGPPQVEPPAAPPPVRVAPVPPPVRVAPVRVAPARVTSRAPAPSVPARAAPPPPARKAAATPPAAAAPERAAAEIKPSFSCRYARGRGEKAVCGNATLARLDRTLAVLYGQSWGQADAARRERLLGTREQFLARREACRSDACVNGVYVRRMREVSEIMAAK